MIYTESNIRARLVELDTELIAGVRHRSDAFRLEILNEREILLSYLAGLIPTPLDD